MSHSSPLIIEAALNGMTPRSRQPHVPRAPAEVAADAIRCIDAGAAIIHSHTDDSVFSAGQGPREGSHDPAPYIEAWRAIRYARPDAILYPTMASGGGATTIARRYSHIEVLAADGLLSMGLVDPGSTNIGALGRDGLPAPSTLVYTNTHADARYMFEACERLGVGCSISIFEPGFLRVVIAYHAARRLPRGSFVKLYFGAAPFSFGLPPTLPSLEAYLAMLDGTGLPWLVSAIAGDVAGCGLARMAIARGGHVQCGLECYDGQRTPTNEELVREIAAISADAGRPVATAAEASAIIGLA